MESIYWDSEDVVEQISRQQAGSGQVNNEVQIDIESCVWAQVAPTAMGVLGSQKGPGFE